jgi:polyisoprenoid-binding protein YceI
MRQTTQAVLMVFSLLTASVVFGADTYTIDPAHTSFDFSVKHMMISSVPGNFDKFDGQIIYSPKDLDNSKVDITIQAASINTRNDQRDTHLKSPDFFDAAKFPVITFVSTKFTPRAITGDLTMKGVTKEITIPVKIAGPVKTMMGGQAIGITGHIMINRQDYGINWNKTLDQGGVAVSNNVFISVSIEADKKASQP